MSVEVEEDDDELDAVEDVVVVARGTVEDSVRIGVEEEVVVAVL